MNPFEALFLSAGKALLSCLPLSLFILIAALFLDWVICSIANKGERNASRDYFWKIFIVLFVCVFIVFTGNLYDEYTSPTYYADRIADRYDREYPATWAYICKNADDPYEYVEYYDSVWGDLQRYHGDGVPFDTLTSYEQSLVHYPEKGSYIYFASKTSKTYHSTAKCYTLLKSNVVSRLATISSRFEPCSKCVGE